MADGDSIMNDLSDDALMGPTDGRVSPVIPQTPRTIARENERSNRRDAFRLRSRGVGRGVARARAGISCFKHLENKVLNPKPDDSPMIKDMKTHMLRKLNSR